MWVPRHTPVLREGPARLRSGPALIRGDETKRRVEASQEQEDPIEKPGRARSRLAIGRPMEKARETVTGGATMGLAGLIRTVVLVGLGAIWLLGV